MGIDVIGDSIEPSLPVEQLLCATIKNGGLQVVITGFFPHFVAMHYRRCNVLMTCNP